MPCTCSSLRSRLGVALLAAVVVLVVLCVPSALDQYPNPPDRPGPRPQELPPTRPVVPVALQSWSQINTSGFGDPNREWVNALTVFGGALHAGVSPYDSSGARVWRLNGAWVPVSTPGFGNTNNSWISYVTSCHGYLYAGTQNLVNGAELWRSLDGNTWSPARTGGFGTPSANAEIMHLSVLSDTLYLAADTWLAPTIGSQIWRSSDGLSWTNVVTGGFGNGENRAIISLEQIGGNYYAGTWTETIPGQLWRSPTGDAGTWQAALSRRGHEANGQRQQ
jgi:hypothetical protein